MKILVFEFAMVMGLDIKSITAEGRTMFEGILDDLKDFETYHLIPEGYENDHEGSTPVTIKGNILEWLNEHVGEYDACLPIAPEENNTLYDITSIIERYGVKVLGSSSKAVKLSTNKLDTYNLLKDDFSVIKTEQVFFDRFNDEHAYDYFKTIFNGVSMVLKPADGVSCSGVRVVHSVNELITAYDDLKVHTSLPYFIVQDHIPGLSVSVSVLCDGETAIPLSLNYQDIKLNSGKIEYNGGKIPCTHKLGDIAKETAKHVVESIDGLKGYVGVDMILDGVDDRVYVLEINSRLTTPYIALRKIINFNVGKAIINAVNGELPSDVVLDGMVKFYKEGEDLGIKVLK